MMMGPAPMMRIVEMSVRLGMDLLGPSPRGGGDQLVTQKGGAASRQPAGDRSAEQPPGRLLPERSRAAGLTRRESARGKGRRRGHGSHPTGKAPVGCPVFRRDEHSRAFVCDTEPDR